MSDIKKTLLEYPDISFIEDTTLEQTQSRMIDNFCQKYKEVTGEDKELGAADPSRLILYAASLEIYQALQYVDNAGKQSFLKYARSDYLDNLGAIKGISREPGSAATAVERFTVSEPQKSVITIPAGTRVTAGDNVFFHTMETVEIKAGEQSVDVLIQCDELGEGRDYDVGEINILVNQIAYIGSVANVRKTQGGADKESDEKLAERIYLAPSSYPTTGTEDSYTYWVEKCDVGISDVKVTSSDAGVAEIRFVMEGGEVPEESIIQKVKEFLGGKKTRLLTEKVEVKAPEVQKFDIDLEYFVAESDRNQAAVIQERVLDAVRVYREWQQERIGRDINPSYLTKLIMNAGAKRVVVASPQFTVLPDEKIAIAENENITYGGIESD